MWGKGRKIGWKLKKGEKRKEVKGKEKREKRGSGKKDKSVLGIWNLELERKEEKGVNVKGGNKEREKGDED